MRILSPAGQIFKDDINPEEPAIFIINLLVCTKGKAPNLCISKNNINELFATFL